MAEVRVTFSANAGVCIEIGNRHIWVDTLHQDKQPGFSAVTQELFQRILGSKEFQPADDICVTHCHPDHYSKSMLMQLKGIYPNAKMYLPEPEFDDQYLLTGDHCEYDDGSVRLEFIRLPHEGAQYANVKHYGLLIGAEGKQILISGDCETASPVLEKAIEDRQIDLAILNFPWVTLAKGRAFISKNIKPKHILLCHLPFAEDDVGGFRDSAQRNAQLYFDKTDIRLLSQPMQTETIKI